MNKRLQLNSTSRPRNRLVAAALFRQAGAHGASRKTQRQRAAASLRKELEGLKGP